MCYFWFPNDLIISSQRKNKAEPITVKQTAQAILSSYMLASANEYTVQRNHNLFTKKKKKSHKNLTSQENCLQWIIQPSVTSSWAPSLFLTWSISFSFFSFLPPPPPQVWPLNTSTSFADCEVQHTPPPNHPWWAAHRERVTGKV